jgi:2-keto-4-pentenoate hydratase
VGAAIARAFVEARRTGAVIAAYPGVAPAALDDAYRIQDAGIALAQHRIGGWKVGRVTPALVDEYGSNRIAGPIFAHRIVAGGEETTPAMPVLAGFAAVEAELLLRVSRTPPPGLSLDAARDHVDEVRFGLEIASSPFTGINDHGPAVTASDFGNNFGLVLGPRIPDWQTRNLLAAPVSLAIDGAVAGQGTLAQMLDGPFGALCFLADSLAQRGLRLEPGQWVSTGAITGVHRIAAGQRASASFDGAFSVACDTIAYTADAA